MLYEEATHAKVPVSLATVYNTLHQFTEVGLLRQVAIDGSKAISIPTTPNITTSSSKTRTTFGHSLERRCSRQGAERRRKGSRDRPDIRAIVRLTIAAEFESIIIEVCGSAL